MTDLDIAVRVLQGAILATALLGALAASFVLADYVGDLIDLGSRNGDFRMTAVIGIRTSGMLAAVLVLFVVFGILALLSPLPPPDRAVRSLVSMGIFEVIVLALTALKLLNLRDRIRLRRGRVGP